MAMNAVVGCEQRNLQAGLGYEFGRENHVVGRGMQDRAHMEVVDEPSDVLPSIQLQHLPNLLRQGHATNKVGDPLVDRELGVLIWQGFSHDASLV